MSKSGEEIARERIREARESGATELNLGNLRLTEVPTDVFELVGLQVLELGGNLWDSDLNQLSALSPEIVQLTNLQHLDLSSNQLSALPPEIGQLTNLQHLVLIVNPLSALPPEIGQLTNLQHLDLSSNQLSALPPEIGQLTNLQHLVLIDNPLSALPPEIGQLTNLQHLDLRSNQLSAFPPEVGQLTNLQYLNLCHNQLSALPPEIGHHSQLRSLLLDENQLSDLPLEVGQLTQLRRLDLDDNRLSELPGVVVSLAQLETLYCQSNHLSAFPPEIGQLTNLRRLVLSSNQLSAFPPEIGRLTNLQHLNFGSNQLSALPPEIGQLTNLRHLSLSGNQLRELPSSLGRLENLSLEFQGNPKLRVLEELAALDHHLFRAYLLSLEEAPRLYEGKLLLVGEGAVGKSTLLAALRGESFQEDRDSTHGVEVYPLPIDHPELAETPIDLRAWDFGGQTVYRISHQFFYSPQALYLVVWEPRSGPEKCEVREWIERIKLRVGDSARILVVATHCQTGDRVARIDRQDLLRDHDDVIAGFFEVDSQTGFGLEELRTAIATEAAELPQMGDRFSPRWQKLRDTLREEKKPRATYAEIVNLGESMELVEIEVRALLTLLHDVGELIYYGHDEDLRNEVILDPEWLAKALSLILEDPETNREAGVLEHRRLREVWEHHGKDDQPTYPAALHPFLLRLMEKYDVCYRLEEAKGSLVGQLVPEVRPDDLPWTGYQAEEGQVSLACDMSETEVPPGLVAWLIVRTHRYAAAPRRHWRRGTFLSYGQHGEALIELRNRVLLITVRADWPRRFMTLLHDHLERLIADRWPGLEAEYQVPCPGTKGDEPCTNRFPLDGLQEFKRQGTAMMPCQTCTSLWSIDQLLIGFRAEQDSVALIRELEAQIRELTQETRAFKSASAERHSVLLQVLAAENKNCPRTFTLLPLDSGSWIERAKSAGKQRLRLNLWCEHPDHPHPICKAGTGSNDPKQGEYVVEASAKWLRDIAPLVNAVAKTLRFLVPLGGDLLERAIGTAIDPSVLDGAKADLELMEKLTSPLLEGGFDVPKARATTGETALAAEGAALREFHSMLEKLDPNKTWGGLRRVLTKSGDYLWLCPSHYQEFEPPLLTHLADG